MKRRNFFRSIVLSNVGAALSSVVKAVPVIPTDKVKPATNVADAFAIPRKKSSMPGKYPGKVSELIMNRVWWMVNRLRRWYI